MTPRIWTPDKGVLIVPRGFRREDYEQSKIARAPFKMPSRYRRRPRLGAFSLVQGWLTGALGGSNTLSKSFASNPTPGNLTVVCASVATVLDTLSVSDNTGDGVAWTTSTSDSSVNLGETAYIFSKVWGSSISGKQITITESLAGTNTKDIFISEYSGNAASPADGVAHLATTSVNPSPGAINATTAGLIVGHIRCNNGDPTAGALGTPTLTRQAIEDSLNNGAVEDGTYAASGNQTASWTHGNCFNITLAACFKVASASVTVPWPLLNGRMTH
jgi:hypothetical protein